MKTKFVFNDFLAFVLRAAEEDPERPIHHNSGWCGCAVGEFMESGVSLIPSKPVRSPRSSARRSTLTIAMAGLKSCGGSTRQTTQSS